MCSAIGTKSFTTLFSLKKKKNYIELKKKWYVTKWYNKLHIISLNDIINDIINDFINKYNHNKSLLISIIIIKLLFKK